MPDYQDYSEALNAFLRFVQDILDAVNRCVGRSAASLDEDITNSS